VKAISPLKFQWRSAGSLSAAFLAAVIFGSACASSQAGRPSSIPAEIVEWHEKGTIGVDRIYVVKVAYRDASGATCTTIVEMDQMTWSLVRDGSPCIVPYGRRYTVSSCP
jgi:hypothetical protein